MSTLGRYPLSDQELATLSPSAQHFLRESPPSGDPFPQQVLDSHQFFKANPIARATEQQRLDEHMAEDPTPTASAQSSAMQDDDQDDEIIILAPIKHTAHQLDLTHSDPESQVIVTIPEPKRKKPNQSQDATKTAKEPKQKAKRVPRPKLLPKEKEKPKLTYKQFVAEHLSAVKKDRSIPLDKQQARYFPSFQDYFSYVEPYVDHTQGLFKDMRIVIVSFAPLIKRGDVDILANLTLRCIDILLMRGAKLSGPAQFVPAPASFSPSDDPELDKIRATQEGWTTHIIVIPTQEGFYHDLSHILSALSHTSLTLGQFVKIVPFSWVQESVSKGLLRSATMMEIGREERFPPELDEAEIRRRHNRALSREEEEKIRWERERRDQAGSDSDQATDDESNSPKTRGLLSQSDFPEGELYAVQPIAGSRVGAATTNVFAQPPGDSDNNAAPAKFDDLKKELEEAVEYDGKSDKEKEIADEELNRAGGFLCDISCKAGDRKDGPNEWLAEKFEEIGTNHLDDHWRTMSYRKGAAAIRRFPRKITRASDLEYSFGIGAKGRVRIETILKTGTHPSIGMNSARKAVIKLFTGMYGVGELTAAKWYDILELRTIEQVVACDQINLSSAQLLGIEHYDDLQKRIPRDEVTALFSYISRAAAEVDAKLEVHCMGSYRRGQLDCGDIDIIVTRDTSDGRDHARMVIKLIEKLHAPDSILPDHCELSVSDNLEYSLDFKFHGLCRLPIPGSLIRRIDFLGVPFAEMPAALIYFTGNDIFNRSLRLKARKMGYSLNEKHLAQNVIRKRGGGSEKICEGTPVPGIKTEADIFRVLGVKMRPPNERMP